MSKLFQRGDRVAPIGDARQYLGNITGTVTHFHGDPPADGESDRFVAVDESDVWVEWSQPAPVGECWMAVQDLERVLVVDSL